MSYDTVVIGAGHNGLAAAVRLSEQGWRVAVVEAKSEPGGAVKTRELTLPGFRHDVCAMNLPMFAGSAFFQAHNDQLLARGLALAPVEDCFATVFRDGTYLGVSRTSEKTLAGISALSAADAEAWKTLFKRFGGTRRICSPCSVGRCHPGKPSRPSGKPGERNEPRGFSTR